MEREKMEKKATPRWANVWGFFAATYAVSWLLWLPAIVAQAEQPNLVLIALGAFAPSTMGIVFTYLTQDRQGRRDFWRRVIDVRRIGWRWGAVIVLIFPLVYTVSGLAFALLGGYLPPLKEILKQLANPLLVAELVVANLILSGFSEELGWRGFALDPLQRKRSALTASLVLGLLHALWHTPLFLIPGLSQGEMGLFSVDYFLFLLAVPLGAVVMTWVYNNTRRSILSAVLLHFFQNLSFNLVFGLHGALPTGYWALLVGTLGLLAAAIVAGWGASTLTGRHMPATLSKASAMRRKAL
jgi:membrane protease YdiL (CAAX protease family)